MSWPLASRSIRHSRAPQPHLTPACLPACLPQILAEVDKDGNGMIDYDEFCAMMKGKSEQAQKGTHNRNHITTKAN